MLYEPHGAVVAPLLVRLATRYPQALYFPYHVSRSALEKHDGVSNDPIRREALRAMDVALASPAIERLVAGFADLHNPVSLSKKRLQPSRRALAMPTADQQPCSPRAC